MKHKKKKQEEEEEYNPTGKSYIQVGEVVVSSSKNNLKSCVKTAEDIIRNKYIKNYLSYFQKKRTIIPSGIG